MINSSPIKIINPVRCDTLNLIKIIEDTAVELTRLSVTRLPQDVKEALQRAYRHEDSKTGKMALKAILDNIELAEKRKSPLCQDTGLIVLYAKVGSNFGLSPDISKALINAVKRATAEIPLRSNIVDPISRKNTGDNTGIGIPHINWECVTGDFLELTVLPKGAGSENMSALAMLKPTEGLNAIKKFIVDTVIHAGGKPCPPTIVGVGIGGSADISLALSKKALLRPINQPHKEKRIAELERELLKTINASGIGPMGLGGRATSLRVNIEYEYCHLASLPVGVNMQCWCARRATAKIHKDGLVEMLT